MVDVFDVLLKGLEYVLFSHGLAFPTGGLFAALAPEIHK